MGLLGCLLSVSLILPGCNILPGAKDTLVKVRPLQMDDLVKGDIDMVAQIQINYTLEYLERLMGKLYRRNPQEWRKSGHLDVGSAVGRVFGPKRMESFPELKGRRSIDSMRLAFDQGFEGDRVLALMEGLRGMILDSYNGKREFYLLDKLDPQKLYYAARNIEIAVWRLSNSRDREGALFLVSNETTGPVRNLSFERLFGKLIVLQDGMARVVAGTTNRQIKNMIQSVASVVFFPI